MNSYVSAAEYNDLRTQSIEIIKRGVLNDIGVIRGESIYYIGELKITDPLIEKKILGIASDDPEEYIKATALYSIEKLKSKSAIPIF